MDVQQTNDIMVTVILFLFRLYFFIVLGKLGKKNAPNYRSLTNILQIISSDGALTLRSRGPEGTGRFNEVYVKTLYF